jgi:hypothetical protein
MVVCSIARQIENWECIDHRIRHSTRRAGEVARDICRTLSYHIWIESSRRPRQNGVGTMRIDLRLLGTTQDGKKCWAEVSVYVNSQKDLQKETMQAAEDGPWLLDDEANICVPDGSKITVESVEQLQHPPRKQKRP